MVLPLKTISYTKARLLLGLLALCLIVSVDAGFAQSNRDLNNRINRLENEIETLSRALFRGEEPPAGFNSGGTADAAAQANLEIRLQQMESELRAMRGQIEEQSFENRQLRQELERITGDLEMRVKDLEQGGSSGVRAGGQGVSVRPTPQQTAPQQQNQYQWNSGNGPQGGSNQQLGSYTQPPAGGVNSGGADLAAATYENAFALLKNSQYDAAEKEFQIFLNDHPDHVLAGNAKYWLGETFYVRGNFEKAARLFAEAYQQFPNGSKAADNLLKLGMSLSAMGKKDDACVALRQIQKEGFQGAGPVLRRAEQEQSRIGC